MPPEDRKRRPRGRGLPTRLYHVSPYQLRVGTHLRPRWSLFADQFRVWMVSSLRGARLVADGIFEFLRYGLPGLCGMGYDRSEEEIKRFGRAVRGVWIYQVKPTGPIENTGKGVWVSGFSARILAMVGHVGEPEKNRLAPNPSPQGDAEIARFRAYDDPVALLQAWRRSATLEDAFDTTLELEAVCADPSEISELFRRMASGGRPPEAELASWYEQKLVSELVKARSDRRREHHKLVPDPRYKRDRRWKGETDD